MESMVVDVNKAIEYEMRQWSNLRSTSEDNYNYYRGDQWCRQSDLAASLKKRNIPVLNKNLILPILTTIIGYQINHKYDLKAYPYDQTPQYLADIITKLLKRINIRSEFVHHLSQATLDALIANIGGYLVIDWTNEDDPLGEFRIRRESPFYHFRDSSNEYYDINKGKYHIRTKWLDEEDLKNSYPENISEIESFINYKSGRTHWTDTISGMWSKITKKKEPSRMDYINDKDGKYRVVELWEMHEKQKKVLINLNKPENMIEITKEMEKTARKLIKGRNSIWDIVNINTRELRIKTVLGGVELLVDDQPYDIQNGRFPFMNIYTHFIDGEPLSNVENLKDYQDEHNKRSGNILQILNSTANSGWWVKKMGDGKLGTNLENLNVNGSNFGFIGTYKGSRPPEKIQPNQLPSGHVYLDQQTQEGIRNTSMIGQNIRGGMESANESGRLFNQRVEQNEIALEPFLENVRYSVRVIGDYLVRAIPKKITRQRIFELVSDDNNKVDSFEVNSEAYNMIKNGRYKVKLEEINNSPTARTKKFAEMIGMAQMMPPQLVYWPAILKESPYEGKEEMAQYAEQQMQQAVEQGGEQQDLSNLKQLAEINKTITPEG